MTLKLPGLDFDNIYKVSPASTFIDVSLKLYWPNAELRAQIFFIYSSVLFVNVLVSKNI